MKHTKNTKSFASRWGFILASVGSAVGMANVWGFPNKMGSNGGGAFLLIYLLFVFIFSYVGLPAEFAMGRRAATGTLGAYENAWATRGRSAGKAGGLLGWLPLAGSMCIAIGYAVIVTYILKALVDSLLGTLMTGDAAVWFASFSTQPYSVIPYHIIVVAGTLLTLFFVALYTWLPYERQDIRLQLPGALISTVGWIGCSYGFSIYFNHFSNYSYMYGSLTAIVVVMLWLYICICILLIGAEINYHEARYGSIFEKKRQ